MLPFVPVSINDRQLLQGFFNQGFRNCDFSFSNVFGWEHFYHATYAVVENRFLCIRFQADGEWPGYLFPLGDGDLKSALQALMQDAADRGDVFMLQSVTRDMFESIERIFPRRFQYLPDRRKFEYIYRSEDLIGLVGKKYQSKRNHIHKFKRSYRWEYLPITREIIPDCLRLYDRWCAENGGCNSEQSLIEERIATHRIFACYEQLGLAGGALRVDGEILAYSYGQPLTADTFGIHAEKSLTSVDGGYATMNQQFAEHNCARYLYINREEDLGLDSLRRAKMSYHPSILLEKGSVKEL
jgi:hypothetical protein